MYREAGREPLSTLGRSVRLSAPAPDRFMALAFQPSRKVAQDPSRHCFRPIHSEITRFDFTSEVDNDRVAHYPVMTVMAYTVQLDRDRS